MFITVQDLANKINHCERFTIDELIDINSKDRLSNQVIKISVFITENGHKIEYCIDTRQERTTYTEDTIPLQLVHMMNYRKATYHEKDPVKGTETIVYSFL